jgi:hypothetical protein
MHRARLTNLEEYLMRKTIAMIGAVASLFTLGACATTDSVKQAQATADQALAEAKAASAAAGKAQGTADQAGASAASAGTSAQGVNDKLDSFIREECAEGKKEAKSHVACGAGTGAVKG